MKRNKKSDSKGQQKRLFEEILTFFRKSSHRAYNYKQVCGSLGITSSDERMKVLDVLETLTFQGMLLEPEAGKYKLPLIESNYAEGKVDLLTSGAAYVIVENQEQDIYINPQNRLNALHGDKVKVHLFAQRRNRRPEGEITEIIERNKSSFVGIIEVSKRFAYVIPDSQKMPIDIFVPIDETLGAQNGDKVVAKITDWPQHAKNPVGEVIQVLGKPGKHSVEMHAIMVDFELPISFPRDVESAANLIPMDIPKDELKKRRDFRSITTFTIDPVDAKDFDDALSIQRLENGNFEIGVHIADVSHFVKPNDVIDRDAKERATSVYLVDRVVPMLPEHLSNGVCSLRPNEEKLCYSAVFEMNENAEVVNEWFGRTVINSDRRFTYEEAQEIIEGKSGDFENEIRDLNRLARKMRDERYKKGAIDFDKVEVKFNLDKEGKPLGVFFKVQKEANQLIEEFMLLANKKVAELIGKPKDGKSDNIRPFVYRIHDKPNPEKLQSFSNFIKQFGYKVKFDNEKKVAESLNKLIKEVKGKGESNIIETLAIRSMAKAVYTTKNIGHYGLGFAFYTHFTSPIRRYPDVMVHRVLTQYLANEKPTPQDELEIQCKHSSEMEKKAADAERASVKYKQVEFLMDKIGEQFDGIISGVTEWGVFVEIVENKCEGMIRLRDMKDDYYYFDEETLSIIGRKYKRRYRLGDAVRIEIRKADLLKKQLDFTLID